MASQNTRYIAIDWFRGLFLIIMTIDHYGNPLNKVTFQAFGFVSMVECFVFVSGLVAGIVYSRYAAQGSRRLFLKTYRRAGTIYIYHTAVILVLFFVELIVSQGQSRVHGFFATEPLTASFMTIFMLYQPYEGVLSMYVVFLCILPFALKAFERNRGWIILSVSFLLWIAAQYGLRSLIQSAVCPYKGVRILGTFDLFAWQFLFIIGAWIGYRRIYKGNLQLPKNNCLFGLCCLLLLFLFLLRHKFIRADEFDIFVTKASISRLTFGWLRLLNFILLAYAIWRLAIAYPRSFSAKWPVFIGSHSLQVYSYQTVAICILNFFNRDYAPADWIRSIIAMALVVSLTLPAYLHALYVKRISAAASS